MGTSLRSFPLNKDKFQLSAFFLTSLVSLDNGFIPVKGSAVCPVNSPVIFNLLVTLFLNTAAVSK